MMKWPMSPKIPTGQAPCWGEGVARAARGKTAAGRNRVVAAGRPRVAPGQAAYGEPAAAHAAVLAHRVQRVRRARRVVAADLAVERADQPRGRPAAGRSRTYFTRLPHPLEATGEVGAEFRVRRPSPPRAAPGPRAQQSPGATRRAPGPGVGVGASRGCGSTALPTALLTTKPTRGAAPPASSASAVGEVDDEGPRPGAPAPADRGRGRSRRRAAGEPGAARARPGLQRGRPQTARLLRPLRRREDRIARPARVRMRRRKPCTL